MKFYEDVILEKSGIAPDFFEQGAKYLSGGLATVRGNLKQEGGDIAAVGQCWTLAGWIMQGATTPKKALDAVRAKISSFADPATPLKVAALHVILDRVADPDAATGTPGWPDIRDRFSQMNWYVGTEAMQALEIATDNEIALNFHVSRAQKSWPARQPGLT